MSFASDFVLARANGDPVFPRETESRTTDRSVLDADRFESLLFSCPSDVDFGPFVGTNETPASQLANRRWLRVVTLLAQFHAPNSGWMEGLWWLDRPNESLDGLTPFEAT